MFLSSFLLHKYDHHLQFFPPEKVVWQYTIVTHFYFPLRNKVRFKCSFKRLNSYHFLFTEFITFLAIWVETVYFIISSDIPFHKTFIPILKNLCRKNVKWRLYIFLILERYLSNIVCNTRVPLATSFIFSSHYYF